MQRWNICPYVYRTNCLSVSICDRKTINNMMSLIEPRATVPCPIHGSCFLPRYFLHVCFFTNEFFYRVHFFLRPLHLLVVFYTWIFYTMHVFSPSPWVTLYMCCLQMVFFTELSLPLASLLTANFTLESLTQRTYFSFTLSVPICELFTNAVFTRRNNSSGSSIY